MWISSIHTKRWRNRMWWWTISGSCPCACERSIKHAVQTARHATVLWTWYPTIRHTVSGGFSLLLMTPKSDKVDTGRQLSVNKSYQHCHDWLVSTKYFQKTVMFVPIEIENMYPGVWRRFPFILIYKGCWISPHISTTGSLPEHHLCLSTFQYKGNVYRHTCAFFLNFCQPYDGLLHLHRHLRVNTSIAPELLHIQSIVTAYWGEFTKIVSLSKNLRTLLYIMVVNHDVYVLLLILLR